MTYIQAKNELQRQGLWFIRDTQDDERHMFARYLKSVRKFAKTKTYHAVVNSWDTTRELIQFKHGFIQGMNWGRFFEATKNGR